MMLLLGRFSNGKWDQLNFLTAVPCLRIIGEFRERKMTSQFAILVFFSLCYEVSNAASSCEQKVSMSYLDTAVDMISKAKHSIPSCNNCGSDLTRGALDCSDLLQMGYNKSGAYIIWPVNRMMEEKTLEVYCDMETNGGGWTLIQRRGNFHRPKDYFYKDWESYKDGFGDIAKDFWLGNDNIFALSNQKLYSVRFDLKDAENDTKYALYDTFWIDDENQQYTLHIADYSGDAGDSMMERHNNQKFTTKDRDNDSKVGNNCAEQYKGGWWYGACHMANLNGLYYRGKYDSSADGLDWYTWKGHDYSMESTEIKIRPKKFRPPHVTVNTPL